MNTECRRKSIPLSPDLISYKLVYLNKGFSTSREKDLEKAENTINEYVADGWTLQEVVSPSDRGGTLIGVFYKESRI